jgi:hypothetical protein
MNETKFDFAAAGFMVSALIASFYELDLKPSFQQFG